MPWIGTRNRWEAWLLEGSRMVRLQKVLKGRQVAVLGRREP